MVDVENLSDLELSLLAEVGNIGAGNAANALASMINRKVLIEIPFVKYLQLNEIPEILGGSGLPVTSVVFKIQGSINGYILFILNNTSAEKLADIVGSGMPLSKGEILAEVGNIISGAYLKSLTDMMGGIIDISIPEYHEDMLGSITDLILGDLYNASNYSFIIATNLLLEDHKLESYYTLLPDLDSLKHIIETIGKTYNL